MKANFMDLDSQEDDSIIVVDESEEEEDAEEVHSQKRKLELEKNKSEAKVTLLSAQSSFLNVAQLTELLVKSLEPERAPLHAKIKTLEALPSLLNKVIKALNKFAQVMASVLKRTKDTSAPLAAQAGTKPAEGEKNTNQVTIS
ncbi:hypothetical protein Tco_1158655 [Tanacetum coccineum]